MNDRASEQPNPLDTQPAPPLIADNDGNLHRIDPKLQLHQLAVERIRAGRDLKVIITAKNSQTGVGKTTLAGWLALSWTRTFSDCDWRCDPENPTEGMATLNPKEYFDIVKQVGKKWPAGTTVLVDDAEELDARRSMQSLNVDFSQRWMLMRLKQAITIITLPSPSSIDSRLEELADIWINVTERGAAVVHKLGVQSYGSRNVMQRRWHRVKWPDISEHPEMLKLQQMKRNKMATWEEEGTEDKPDPKEVEKQTKIETAQRLRDQGVPILSQKPDQQDIVSAIDMSQSWVSKNTTPPEES